jgi:ABC-type branched-subunit amino acid transport system ATPase component/ABC-type branched-subunit amino acid transport system permease subunit
MLLPWLLTSTLERHLLVLIAINVLLVSGLDLLIGYTGLLSLAHAGFWGIGAYTSALLMRGDLPFLATLPSAGLVASACGLFLGYPALKLRGHYFVVVTFISGIILTILMNVLGGVTRGPLGLPGIPFAEIEIPGLFSHRFNPFRDKLGYYYLVLAFTLLALFVKERLVRSPFGRALVAIREDEDLAQTVGIRTHRYKVLIFALSAGLAGIAGSLYAHYVTYISPESFTFRESFDLFVMNLVGGAGSTAGPVLGPVFLTLLGEVTRQFHPAVSEIAFGVILIATIAFLPGGLVGGLRRLSSRIARPAPRATSPEPAHERPSTPTAPALRREGLLDPSADDEVILRVERLVKDFGGFRAVAGVSFAVRRGEITGLVGPNGAGKTTIFHLITGFLLPTAGEIVFRDQVITKLPPQERARLGLVRTFQSTKIFSRLTVEENVRIGCHLYGPRSSHDRRARAAEVDERVQEILEFTGLCGSRGKIAADLPYGEGRTLEIAVALGADPELLLLDEPFAGMNPAEAERCMELIHGLRGAGRTILLVDHHMDTLIRHCDRLIVLHHGEKLAEGLPEEIKDDPQVIEVYLGSAAGLRPQRPRGGATHEPA